MIQYKLILFYVVIVLSACVQLTNTRQNKNSVQSDLIATEYKMVIKSEGEIVFNVGSTHYYYAFPNYIATNGNRVRIIQDKHLVDSSFRIYSTIKVAHSYNASDIKGDSLWKSEYDIDYKKYLWNILKEGAFILDVDTIKTYTQLSNNSRIYIGICIVKDSLKYGPKAEYEITLNKVIGNKKFYILKELERKNNMRVTEIVVKTAKGDLVNTYNYFKVSPDSSAQLNRLINKVKALDAKPSK